MHRQIRLPLDGQGRQAGTRLRRPGPAASVSASGRLLSCTSLISRQCRHTELLSSDNQNQNAQLEMGPLKRMVPAASPAADPVTEN